MNKAKLKSYAPAARRDFMQAVTDRAHYFGLSATQAIPVEESGDVAIIGGRPFPRAVAAQRRKLDARVKRDGFSQVMEAVAYTWFNRFLALRYMELHGYLEHGFRVLSNTGSSTVPEILDHATQLDLPGLNKQKVIELKLDGSKDAELYRMLLVAQCNALHSSMPFLFEKIEDETELLLPDNLLHSDSLIRKLVSEIDEEDWQEVEIIGWLYQFYISEKKDEVIGKVVKSEDIPAATQLFTPNWIVKYMVQNSLGRKWLATYPDSPLKTKMEYYIEPAEQTAEVNAQLAAITPASLNPEELTLLDPACGSGHILVEAYDVFKEIYLERGYSSRDFPRLILEKNLFGLDIDDRAAQMAGFALLMKARKDDRRILRSDNPVKLNVLAIQESVDIKINDADWGQQASAIRELVELFQYGKTFGSLVQVSRYMASKLTEIENSLKTPELHVFQTASEIKLLVEQANLLARKYDCVVANPPYMGYQYLNEKLKVFATATYPNSKGDLFAIFVDRMLELLKDSHCISIMSPFTWLFIGSYENFRRHKIENFTILSIVKPEYHSFFDSAFVPVCAFTIQKMVSSGYKSTCIDMSEFYGADIQSVKLREGIADRGLPWVYTRNFQDFKVIPSCPMAYSLKPTVLKAFKDRKQIGRDAKKGVTTGDNERFLRFWTEVDISKSSLFDGGKWFPMTKGGAYRKWYGNFEWFINWQDNGQEIRNFKDEKGKMRSAPRNLDYNFKEGITWNDVTIADFTARYVPNIFVFNAVGPMIFGGDIYYRIGMLNSKVNIEILRVLCPTMKFEVGSVSQIPIGEPTKNISYQVTKECVDIAKQDWDSFETSWDFNLLPTLTSPIKSSSLCDSWINWQSHCNSQIKRMQELEIANNRYFIEDFGLQDEISPDISEDQITLARAEREADMKRLISYSIGCIMGRYSLDYTGLVYANSGNNGFDQSNYQSFPADDDGIVPVMDMDWFSDDAACRFDEFLKVAWSPETLEENLKFVADSLSPKGGETPRETIRRYISTQFFKDHLQTYKKRPIYWLFSSGKQRAFECLVYLHRYNESTLSRMRNEYVTPLQGKFSAQVDYLSNEVNAASSTAERNRLQKQLDALRKKQVELASFDDLLRHYADQRISLDLDDGVKVNYGKFGALLSEVKSVTGGVE